MKSITPNNSGFSVIIAIFMVGFLLILTTGVFNLVLKELNNNRGGEKYLKAYAGAEGAMELGLLGIKNNGYGFDKDVLTNQSGSEVLSFNSSFNKSTDAQISYQMDIKTNSYSGTLLSGETNIIPLFWLNESSNGSAKNINLNVISGVNTDIVWNIIGNGEGMSGIGGFTPTTSIDYTSNNASDLFKTSDIRNFLTSNTKSYLMLYNKSTSGEINYNLSTASSESFSKPTGNITSSVQIGKYKQNISTQINNTEFLNMLKYSIYDN